MVEIQKAYRLPALDGLRAFAVGAVFLSHAYGTYFPGGFIGVDLFFVLSGFVITRQLLFKGIDLKRFYLHRATRILPPVFPVLAFSAITVFMGLELVSPFDIFMAAVSLLNWSRAFNVADGGMLGHFWSLAVEEQFYFVWPLALLLLIKGRANLPAILVLIVIAAIALQLAIYVKTQDHFRVYNGADTRFSQLAMGCLLAAMPQLDARKFWVVPVLFFAIAVFAFDPGSQGYLTWGIPLAGGMAMLLIATAAWSRSPLNLVLEHPILQWGGSRSYAIYLWHYPMLMLGFKLNGTHNVPAIVPIFAALVLTLGAAELSQRFVERPARMLRDKIDAGMLRRQAQPC